MMIKTYAAVAMAGLVLTGCAEDSGPKETSGALIGGIAGGLIGNTVGNWQGGPPETILSALGGCRRSAKWGRKASRTRIAIRHMAGGNTLSLGPACEWENPGQRATAGLQAEAARDQRR